MLPLAILLCRFLGLVLKWVMLNPGENAMGHGQVIKHGVDSVLHGSGKVEFDGLKWEICDSHVARFLGL